MNKRSMDLSDTRAINKLKLETVTKFDGPRENEIAVIKSLLCSSTDTTSATCSNAKNTSKMRRYCKI